MENKNNLQMGAKTENKQSGQTGSMKSMTDSSKNRDTPPLDQSVKETATGAIETVKEKAASVLDEQKQLITSGLSSVAGELRKAGGSLRGGDEKNYLAQQAAHYGENLAGKVEDFSGYLERASLKDLTRDLENLARRQPTLFVGGAFAIGVLAARFLKSSAPRTHSHHSNHLNQANDLHQGQNSGVASANSQTNLQNV